MTRTPRPRGRMPRAPITGLLILGLLVLTGSGADSRTPALARAGSGPVRAAPTPGSTAASATFRWPLDGVPRPVRRFDPPPRPWLPGHRGVDLAAASGAVVRATGAGTVSFAGPVAGRPVISISHPGGLRTTYEPVRPAVSAGDRVAAGDPLGVLLPGHPGCRVAACLHWGLREGVAYLDPLALLGLGRIRLLPLADQPALRHPGAAQAPPESSVGNPSASRSYSAGRL